MKQKNNTQTQGRSQKYLTGRVQMSF